MKQNRMNNNLPEYNNEHIYNRGRMDEKRSIAIRLYCMDTDIDDISNVVDESTDQIKLWIDTYRQELDRQDEDWETYYTAAKRYYDENGDLNIDPTYSSPDGLLLGLWLRMQKETKAGLTQCELTERQINMLDKIGIDWDYHTIKFNPDRSSSYMPEDISCEAFNSDHKIYGYANVSPDSRDDALRLIASYDTEIPEENIFIDLHTGAEIKHDQYDHLMHLLAPGDLLYIKNIDSLGRNYDEIIKQWKYITNEKKADIVAIDTPILDTRRGRDMMNTLITEVLLVQLSYLSESQKINRKKRQAEGISKAKAKGTRFGKPSVTLPANFPEVYRRYKRKELSVSEAADLCSMARTTFYDNVKRYEKSFKAK